MYNYIIRPAEGSGNLIIEIIDLPEDKDFVKQLIRAFESIKILVVNYEDLWMNDEIVLNATSDIGPSLYTVMPVPVIMLQQMIIPM